jgi:hypothetical protein
MENNNLWWQKLELAIIIEQYSPYRWRLLFKTPIKGGRKP